MAIRTGKIEFVTADDSPVVPLGQPVALEAVFLGNEQRGISVRLKGAAGSANIVPAETHQGGLEIGDRIIVHAQISYVASTRGAMGLQAARLALLVVRVTPAQGFERTTENGLAKPGTPTK